MSDDIPDQNQHATADAIGHLINTTPALPLLEAVAQYMEENTTEADRVYFASCVVQSLKAHADDTMQSNAALHHAHLIHAALHAVCNGKAPPTVHDDGYGVPIRTCSNCGDDSADQTGDCADWCSPECADGNPEGRFDAITADDDPEYDRRMKAALKAINAAVNMGHTTFERLFLGFDSVDCPTCSAALDFTSEDGFHSQIEVSCDCYGTVSL